MSAADAYAKVRAAIVESRYPPGHRLVEQRIAEELGLSRTPVREALRMLQAEGLVVSERNRGAMVRPLSPTEVVDLVRVPNPAPSSILTTFTYWLGLVTGVFDG